MKMLKSDSLYLSTEPLPPPRIETPLTIAESSMVSWRDADPHQPPPWDYVPKGPWRYPLPTAARRN